MSSSKGVHDQSCVHFDQCNLIMVEELNGKKIDSLLSSIFSEPHSL